MQRKFGSVSDNFFFATLDEDLRRKLDSIGKDKDKTVTAERQAERAARVCDIIVEEKEK